MAIDPTTTTGPVQSVVEPVKAATANGRAVG